MKHGIGVAVKRATSATQRSGVLGHRPQPARGKGVGRVGGGVRGPFVVNAQQTGGVVAIAKLGCQGVLQPLQDRHAADVLVQQRQIARGKQVLVQQATEVAQRAWSARFLRQAVGYPPPQDALLGRLLQQE
jgi:hypothetical protein